MKSILHTTALLALLFTTTLCAAAGLDDAKAALRGMAGFGAGLADALVPDGNAYRAPLPGADSGAQLHLVAGPEGSWQAVLLPKAGTTLDPERLWPGMGSEVFGGARLVPQAVVVSSADAEVNAAAWPAAVQSALGESARGKVALKKGVNAFMTLAPGTGGALGQVQRAIGMTSGSIALRGSTGPELLAQLISVAAGTAAAAPAPYQLTALFPAATPSAFANLDRGAFSVTFPSTTIGIAGAGRSFTLGGQQRVSLTVMGKLIGIDNSLSLTKSGANWAIACQGAADADADLFGTAAAGLALRRFTLGGDLASNPAPGARRVAGFGMSVGAVVDVSGVGPLQGELEVELVDGKVTELALALRGLAAGGISLASLPGLQQIPGAGEFAFTQIGVGVRPGERQGFIYGDLRWARQGVQATAAVLLGQREKALFFKARGLSLRKLSAGLPAELEIVTLDNAVLALSTGALDGIAPSLLPGTVRRMIAEVGASGEGKVSFGKGVTLLTAFNPGESGKALGLTQPVVLAGSIGGVFGDDPSLALEASLGGFALPKSAQPSFIQAKSVAPRFFIVARDLRSAAAVDLGVAIDSIVTIGRDRLDLGVATYVSLGKANASVRARAQMRGEWRQPLGLQGLTLSDSAFLFAFAADGTTSLGLAAKLGIDRDIFDSQNIIGLTPIGGVRHLAISFKATTLAAETPLRLMDILARSAANGPLADAFNETDRKAMQSLANGPSLVESARKSIPLDLVKLKDAQVLLATPGVPVDPALPAIQGAGVGAAGRLLLNDREVGRAIVMVTESTGMRLAGDIADVDFGGLLSLKGAKLDVKVPPPLQGIPSFLLKGQANVLGNAQALDVELGIAKIRFMTRNDWGAMGKAEINAESLGASLLQPTDFVLSMSASADLKNGLRKQLVPALLAITDGAGGHEQAALSKAEADIKPLRENLKSVRAEASKNKRSAESGIRAAEKQVDRWDNKLDDLDDDIDDLEDKIDDGKDDPAKWDKLAGWGIELGALKTRRAGAKVAYGAAKAALRAAKDATTVVPVDLYPEVIDAQAPVTALQAEIDSLRASLAANTAVRKLAEDIRNAAKAIPVTVQELSLKDGSLAQALKGRPQRLRLKMILELPGKKPLHMDSVLRINLLNPGATDLQGVATLLRDAMRDIDRLIKAQEGADDDETAGRKRKSKRKATRPPTTMFTLPATR